MAKRPRRRTPPGGRRLNTSLTAGAEPVTVPVRWVKFFVGLLLLPVCYIVTAAFFGELTHAAVDRDFWRTEQFYFFVLGLLLWLIVYLGLPSPLWVYVFGHELTHALVVLLMGGKVSKFYVGPDGGHIISSKINTWIALSPYFVPIYSVLVIAAYGVGSLFYDLTPYLRLLYALLGFTWGFHAAFTLSMIPKGQTDLAYGGNFFSLVVIYLMNVLVLSVLLIVATPDVGLGSFFSQLDFHATAFASDAVHFTGLLLRAAGW